MLKSILRRLFYNPERHARRLDCVTLGRDSILLPDAYFRFRVAERAFRGSIEIGADSLIAAEFNFESDQGRIRIGDRSFINGSTRLICRQQIEIGSDVTIAWGCTLYDHNSHSLDWRQRALDIQRQIADLRAGRDMIHGKDWSSVTARPIRIEDKAWLGFNVIVLNGVTIGEGAIIGAGSVVREDVPAWSVAAGNPARVLRRIEPT